MILPKMSSPIRWWHGENAVQKMGLLLARRRIDLPHLEMSLVSVHLHRFIRSMIVRIEEINQLSHRNGDLTIGKEAIGAVPFLQLERWIGRALEAKILFLWPVVSEFGVLI